VLVGAILGDWALWYSGDGGFAGWLFDAGVGFDGSGHERTANTSKSVAHVLGHFGGCCLCGFVLSICTLP
jgi:hypothetical protein